jgi:hypothetical protein
MSSDINISERIEAAALRLEKRGVVYRDGFRPGRGGRPCNVWCATSGGDVIELMLNEMKRDFVAWDKLVVQILNAVELVFNLPATQPDGWYWGPDGRPFLFGPFESREEAVDDARDASNEPVKVVVRDQDYLTGPEEPDHFDGYVTIIVTDTDGEIWRTAREVCEGITAEGRRRLS